MSKDFDDVANLGGTGVPSVAQVVAVRDHMKSRNKSTSVRSVSAELVACGFDASIATTARRLREAKGFTQLQTKSPTKAAERRVSDRRHHRKAEQPSGEGTITPAELLGLDEATLIPKMAELLVDATSSTQLAIRENRARMALNIIIAETMASKAPVLLLDMRGTAALVDALTVAAKLSGGASIDIIIPTDADRNNEVNGVSPGGHPMREVNAPANGSGLVTEIARWKTVQKQNGQGA